MTNYKPVFTFQTVKRGERSTNEQVFATYKEAHDSALSRFQRWTMPGNFYVDTTENPVNCTFDHEEGDKSL